MGLTGNQIALFLLGLSLLLMFARLFGEISNKLRQPFVVGEIIAGVILGPTILGTFAPDIFKTIFPQGGNEKVALDAIINLSVVMLLLISGLELDLTLLFKHKKKAFSTSLMGILFPFGLGFYFTYFFPSLLGTPDNQSYILPFFIGTALSISALPVIAKTLMELRLLKTEIGFIIISSAMFNDLIGWLIFSVILSYLEIQSHSIPFGWTIGLMLFFTIVLLTIGRRMFNRIIPLLQSKLSYPGAILNFIFVAGFMAAAFTEYIGIHAVFGAFIVGVSIGNSEHLKENTRENIQQFVTNIFAPLFFASIGLKVNFFTNFDLVLVLVVLVLAFAGKIIGCYVGARFGGMNKFNSLAVGFGMNSRGAMEIILGSVALSAGIISEQLFVALVIMALVTSITSAPFIKYFLKLNEGFTLQNLLSSVNVMRTNYLSKEEAIYSLVQNAVGKNKLDVEDIYNTIIEREEQNPTGIANYLAIPHTRINFHAPLISIAINDKPLDFSASDGTHSKIIFLLLTPEDENKMQLDLLSQIVYKFRTRESAEDFIKTGHLP